MTHEQLVEDHKALAECVHGLLERVDVLEARMNLVEKALANHAAGSLLAHLPGGTLVLKLSDAH